MKKSLLVVILLLVCLAMALAVQDPESPIKCRQVSPDGQKVGYLARDDLGVWQPFVKNVDGSDRRQVTFFYGGEYVQWAIGSGVMSFCWSPDSQKILISVLTPQFEFPTKSIGRARRANKDYNNHTLLLVDIKDLTTLYMGGCDVKISETAVDISEVQWLDSERIQFRYKLWDNNGKSEGIRIRSTKEGKPLQDNSGSRLAWEQFFQGQYAASAVAKMIVNKKPIFSDSCTGEQRRTLLNHLNLPKVWIIYLWPNSSADLPGESVADMVILKGSNIQALCLYHQRGKIVYAALESTEGAP